MLPPPVPGKRAIPDRVEQKLRDVFTSPPHVFAKLLFKVLCLSFKKIGFDGFTIVIHVALVIICVYLKYKLGSIGPVVFVNLCTIS
jgi:hypothetical protein